MSGAIGESRIRVLVVAGLLCTAAALYGGERILTHSEYQMKKLSEKETLARQGRIADADKLFAEGKALWAESKYSDAQAKIARALSKLADVPGNAALNRYADMLSEYNQMCTDWGRQRLQTARKKYAKGDYSGAMADAPDILNSYRGALNFAFVTRTGAKMLAIPGDLYEDWQKAEKSFSSELDDLIRTCQGRLNATGKARETSLAGFDENHSANRQEIARLQRAANTYIQNKQYVAAIDALEKIYLIDPFDVYATSTLKKVYSKM